MLNNITFYLILGKPLIMYLGILTFLSLITTAIIGYFLKIGKIKIKYHLLAVIITITLAIIHGLLGILLYF